jgi:hypothetical protein
MTLDLNHIRRLVDEWQSCADRIAANEARIEAIKAEMRAAVGPNAPSAAPPRPAAPQAPTPMPGGDPAARTGVPGPPGSAPPR